MFIKFLLIGLLFLTSCKTTQNHEDKTIVIKVPQHSSNINETLFFNTQIIDTKIKNGLKYEFYYGTGGRYIVKVKSLQGTDLPYEKAESTLLIEKFTLSKEDDQYPETISMAANSTGIYSGFGFSRNGKIKITFDYFIPESKYNSLIDESFIIIVDIKDIN